VNALTLPDKSGSGLLGAYYFGNQFQTPWTQRVDSQVNFAWGTEGPFPKLASGTLSTARFRLPAGRWLAEWLEPKSGRVLATERLNAVGDASLAIPEYAEDLALRIRRSR
jgi:hypothetical protein